MPRRKHRYRKPRELGPNSQLSLTSKGWDNRRRYGWGRRGHPKIRYMARKVLYKDNPSKAGKRVAGAWVHG